MGAVGGLALVALDLDRGPSEPRPEAAVAPAAGLEVGSWSDDEVLFARGDFVRSEHDFGDRPGHAEFDLAMAHALYGPVRWGDDAMRVTPLFGLGLGYARYRAIGAPGIGSDAGFVLALAGGFDFEFVRTVRIDLLLSVGTFGEPGDTEGTFGAVLIGGGVRF